MTKANTLTLKPLGINTYKEAVVYMRKDCPVCRSEGFEAPARVKVIHKNKIILATLNTIESDLLTPHEASLSTFAWEQLSASIGDEIQVFHPDHLNSLDHIRGKIYGHELNKDEIREIIKDVVNGSLSDIHISAFLASTGDDRFSEQEIFYLTESMIEVGNRISWHKDLIVDKHCIGGLPGNRTTLIVVPIVAAFGLTIPKTSSRAITSPAGTADTMEVFAPVSLDLNAMRKVIEKENGCLVWGGSVNLSPADDILIRIERALILDSMGQLVASILSKKIAAGSSHVIIDVPIGPTVKVRTTASADELKNYLEAIGKTLGIEVKTVFTDGSQPVGRGIGPALEAKDVLAVLQGDINAPQSLRERSIALAGQVLEFSPNVRKGTGYAVAEKILSSGQAWQKFQAICHAQGGLFEPPIAKHMRTITSKKKGTILAIDNRYLSRVAKLAGAPQAKAAGIKLLTPIGTKVNFGDPLFEIHAETKGELHYAVNFLSMDHEIFDIGEFE
ncbi:thymidine phosphorylase [Candidatus Berkiella aquae]|uniref:Putative thymidine phosphorylase n=1 Tax=Candidatus Berkiella aquae TaxID=295108 RepID=A0A0Q9YNQ4_9GAMM|nr:thymidine phosphorylase family protein [Candidatus Berkiella aquae]MCS5711475.1 thymidine phosphorylase family protein [Candidatus Berkiella aquae]